MQCLTATGPNLRCFKILRTCCVIQDKHGQLICRSMSQGIDHIERTAENTRQKEMSKAVVTKIANLSPTVKGLRLKVNNHEVSFKAGQWVDFAIPQIKGITGYTMCSSPAQLIEDGSLDLAVKFSDHKITSWVHEKCEVGSVVEIRVGGDFFFDPLPASARGRSVLLIAGGVGINPMVSIIRHISDLQEQQQQQHQQQQQQQQQQHQGNEPIRPFKACLMYSARTADELIFRSDLDDMYRKQTNLLPQYFVTGDAPHGPGISHGRIKESDIEEAVRWLGCKPEQVDAYICGPGPMIDDLCHQLTQVGLPASSVHFERWW